jgi:thiosulfate reductase cytochrome b subunit
MRQMAAREKQMAGPPNDTPEDAPASDGAAAAPAPSPQPPAAEVQPPRRVTVKTLKAKHPRAIRWFHWVNFPLLALMIWSGLLIYWANDVYRIGWGKTTLFHFFPDSFYMALGIDYHLADGMAWHFFFALFFAINGIAYVLYTVISGEWRYLVPNRQSFREAIQVTLHDLGLRREAPPQKKFNGAQQIAYTGVVLMGGGSLLTGIAIWKSVQFGWLAALLGGYEAARLEHFYLAGGYVLFFLVHITQVIRAGWNNFRGMVTGFEIADQEVEHGPENAAV